MQKTIWSREQRAKIKSIACSVHLAFVVGGYGLSRLRARTMGDPS
jgi:hypothetical protein